MHLSIDRGVAAIAILAVISAVVLVLVGPIAFPKVPAEVWPNVTALFE